jgi:hypothetical protein
VPGQPAVGRLSRPSHHRGNLFESCVGGSAAAPVISRAARGQASPPAVHGAWSTSRGLIGGRWRSRRGTSAGRRRSCRPGAVPGRCPRSYWGTAASAAAGARGWEPDAGRGRGEGHSRKADRDHSSDAGNSRRRRRNCRSSGHSSAHSYRAGNSRNRRHSRCCSRCSRRRSSRRGRQRAVGPNRRRRGAARVALSIRLLPIIASLLPASCRAGGPHQGALPGYPALATHPWRWERGQPMGHLEKRLT